MGNEQSSVRPGAARPLTWFGISLSAVLALLTVYLPFEFEAPLYQHAFPYLRLFGLDFGLTFMLLAAAELEVGLPDWLRVAGKVGLAAGSVGMLLTVAIPFAIATRMVFYGALIAALVASLAAPNREVELFRGFLVIVLAGTGLAVLLHLGAVDSELKARWEWIGPMLLLAAALQVVTAGGRRRRWEPVANLAGVLPFGWAAAAWMQIQNWTGAAIYAVLAVSLVGWAIYLHSPWSVPIRGLQRRILALAMAVSVVPTLLLGAAAVYGLQVLNHQVALQALTVSRMGAEREVERLVGGGEPIDPAHLSHLLLYNLDSPNGTAPLVYFVSDAPPGWTGHEGAITELGPGGVRRLVSYTYRPDLGLVIAMAEEAGAARSVAEPMAVWLMAGTIAIAGMAVGMAVPISERLTLRLSQIRTVAEAVGEQHFDVRVPHLPGDDEVAILAGTINEMAATLGIYNGEIQAQSEELRAQNEQLQAQAEELGSQNDLLQRQQEELRRRAEQQESVSRLGQRALAGASVTELMQDAVRLLVQSLHFDFVAIWELLPDGHSLRMSDGHGWPDGVIGHAAVREEDTQASSFSGYGITSSLSAPIPGGFRPHGALSGYSLSRRVFTPDDAYFVQSVANVLASGLTREQAERFSEVQRAVTQILAESTVLSEAAPRVMEATCTKLDWDLGVLWWVNPEEGALRCRYMWHRPEVSVPQFETLTAGVTFRRGEGMLGTVWASGTTLWSADVATDVRFKRTSLAVREKLHGAVFFPVVLDGDVTGVMEFFSRQVRQPDPEMLNLMSGFGNQISQFLARKRSEEERELALIREREARVQAEATTEQIRRLQAVTDAVFAHLTADTLVSELISRTKDALKADQCLITLLDAERTVLRLAAATPPVELAEGASIRFGDGFTGHIVATGRAMTTDDLSHIQGVPAMFLKSLRSAAGAPLVVEGHVIGAVAVGTACYRRFTPEDVQLLQLAADRIAVAIDRARLWEAEVKARRDVEAKSREIQLLNADLERRVVERTAQLETAVKELEAFAYSVSHDLRAPLRSIDGFSHVLLEDYSSRLDDDGRDMLNRVRSASQRMGQLIDALLHLSRVTRSEMQMETVDLSQMARSIVNELQRSDPARDVAVEIADGCTARGDGRLLRVVLENLIGNAWKFTMRNPHPCIQFGATDVEGKPALYVRDNGVGFKMEYADKLFLPFQRLHSDRDFPGTGIGLATVHRIIHRHGGNIWAEADPGKGATFYFTLG